MTSASAGIVRPTHELPGAPLGRVGDGETRSVALAAKDRDWV